MRWFVGWIGLLCACAIGRVPPPTPPRTTSLGLTFEMMQAPNGLKVLVVEDPKASEIQVTMRYRVGAADDPASREGMAHLVEHLMFQQVLGSETLFSQLETVTTYFNGTTTPDATTYVARADKSRLDKLLAIEATRLGFRCTTIAEPVFVREREVVINEMRYRDDAKQLYRALLGGVYPTSHPYQRAVGGSPESVGSISFTDACAFADAFYTTENAALVVSGNVTGKEVAASLEKFLARVARRPATGIRAAVPVASRNSSELHVQAPVDTSSVMFAWPVPQDPLLATRVRTIAAAAAQVIDGAVNGKVHAEVIGDERAPVFAVIIEPGSDESPDDVIENVGRTLGELPAMLRRARVGSLGEVAFNSIQQEAIYELYAGMELDSDRDAHLASYMLAGRDPRAALAAEFQALRDMRSDVAADIAREYLTLDKATTVMLDSEAPHAGTPIALRPPVHDQGQRHAAVDPAAAHAAEVQGAAAREVSGVRARTLPNGMKVLLLPATSVPTVELRLVFGAGTADEPLDRRGAALVAAYGLGWDIRFLDDMLEFLAAGGSNSVAVDTDRTTFMARGVDMHIDVLLAGLRRWVREGTYEAGDSVVAALRATDKRGSDDGALTDAWRTALFGAGHPYTYAGLVRHVSTNLALEDGERFRAAHFTPDNATLVIAGRFDPALADQWIDYLFADWAGTATPRAVATTPASRPPAAISLATQGTSVLLRVAIPASGGTRPQQLVAAAMLSEIARDVRHQLGAAYVIDAALVSRRQESHYEVIGSIEASRATEAVTLLRDRLAQLRTDPDAAAIAFVAARRRVMTRLGSFGSSAAGIADALEHDIELARAPLADLALVPAVAGLTIEGMASTFAELDLSHAIVLMRGPRDATDPAFAALGRQPELVRFDQVAADSAEDVPGSAPAAARRKRTPVTVADLEESLTSSMRGVRSRWTFTVAPGFAIASTNEPSRVHADCCSGVEVLAFAGYRIDRVKTLGVQLATGYMSGSYSVDLGFSGERFHYRIVPISVTAAVEGNAYDRLWGGVHLGLHLDQRTRPMPGDSENLGAQEIAWNAGLAIGVQGGADVVKLDGNRLGVFGLIEGSLGSDNSFGALTLGVAYRR